MTVSKLSRAKIESLLRELNSSLVGRSISGEIYLLGGAVMCLAFKARKATQDLNAIFEPKETIMEAAHQIAVANKLPPDWLNDAVKGFLSSSATFEPYLDLSNLKVFTATAEYIFAMKCLSFRIGPEFADEEDVRFLLRYLNIRKAEDAINLVKQYYPEKLIPQKTYYALQEILSSE